MAKRAYLFTVLTGLALLGGGARQRVLAASTDTVTVTVSADPSSILYGVQITSPEVQGYDFAQVAIGATTLSTRPIGVKNTGNMAEFFAVSVVDITPSFAWTNNGVSLAPGTTSFVMQGQFVASGAVQPASTALAGASNNVPAVAPLTASGTVGQGTTRINPGNSLDLWLQLQMPTGVNDAGTHTMVLTINGQSN
jgi:hypothetical protein